MLYSCKRGFNRAKLRYLVKSGCIRAKVAVFGHKWLYSGKRGCIRESGCMRAKVVEFGQKWLKSDKVVVLGKK